MRTIARILVGLTVITSPCVALAAIPSIDVTVSDSSGKPAYKGATNSAGSFATGPLKPGGYVVQFNSKSAPKGARYAVVVSAGRKKVAASNVEAEKLAGGGVAMKIDVGAGLKIAGQVTTEDKRSAPIGSNGKPMVWIPKKTGSNLAAHWAESDSGEAKEFQTTSGYSTKAIQDKQAQGIAPKQNGN
jgi:hypothetical protein